MGKSWSCFRLSGREVLARRVYDGSVVLLRFGVVRIGG